MQISSAAILKKSLTVKLKVHTFDNGFDVIYESEIFYFFKQHKIKFNFFLLSFKLRKNLKKY